jgi:hypothetical protein
MNLKQLLDKEGRTNYGISDEYKKSGNEEKSKKTTTKVKT